MLKLQPATAPANLLAAVVNDGAVTPTANASAQAPTFARLLQDNRPASTTAPRRSEPEAGPRERAAEPKAEAAPQPAAAEAATAQRPTAAHREGSRARDDGKRATPSPARQAKASATPPDASGREKNATAAETASPTVPSNAALADWLASLKLPEPTQATALPAGGNAAPTDRHADADAAACDTVDAASTTAAADRAAGLATAAATAAGQAAMAALALGGTPPASTGRSVTEGARDRSSESPLRPAATDAPNLGLVPATAAAARHGAGDAQAHTGGGDNRPAAPAWVPVAASAAAPAGQMPAALAAFGVPAALRNDRGMAEPMAVNLGAPVDSPEFPRALGVELAVLARNGIEQAELHLSPAEMGPVSVQIAIDGTQARIDFGADVAGTRQAIEAGLPELASALRDAGLTLTGGGVSQHSRGRGDGQGPADGSGAEPQHGRSTGRDQEVITPPIRRTVRAGGVDMYA